MRPIRTIAMFPTTLTLGNLVCGFFAIVVAARVDKPDMATMDLADVNNVSLAAWLIFLAMVFDALDGYVARLSGTASDFGAQLDSLCDLVTFGVAPGFLLVKMCPRFTHLDEFVYNDAIWVIAAAFAACAALRLARFNVETSDEDEHLSFSGLPAPAAAAAIAAFAILFHTLRHKQTPLVYAEQIEWALQTALPFFAVFVALLMVSRIPYPHVVNQVFRGQRTFGHVVGVVFALVAVMVIRGYSVPIICCGFALLGPARVCWAKLMGQRRREDSLF
ncbi:MAG: CDP-diacylglycerol--serine O-phosphatidyltransferase [Candidatus Nealsonbacteria bacterium]|nr:CDP-diacylglycerol--serine O-phosphatidyltransferase [Candidatus Nealsonbacteria bacterium]